MARVFSLMATHSDVRSVFKLSVSKKNRYTQVSFDKVMYTNQIANPKSRMRIRTLSCTEKNVHVGNLIFRTMVFGPMVLELGIASEVLNPSLESLVFVLYGFGPWF